MNFALEFLKGNLQTTNRTLKNETPTLKRQRKPERDKQTTTLRHPPRDTIEDL